jgi:hypothetical protein
MYLLWPVYLYNENYFIDKHVSSSLVRYVDCGYFSSQVHTAYLQYVFLYDEIYFIGKTFYEEHLTSYR